MTQATLYSVPTVGPATPTVMAQRIDDNFDAIISGHSGSARPAYAVAGTVWQDTSVVGTVKYYHYDGSDDILMWSVNTATNVIAYAPVPNDAYRGAISGLTLSNNASDAINDIDIAAGFAGGDGTLSYPMTLATSLTKRTDAAWSVGTNAGMWMDGASMPNGTGHVFLIRRPDTGVVDIGASASLTPTLPANYTQKRRIGSILRESATIVPFTQVGDEFLRKTAILSVTAVNPGTSAVSRTLNVPAGIQVMAKFNFLVINASNAVVAASLFTPLDVADQAPATFPTPGGILASGILASNQTGNVSRPGGELTVRTNTSAQIRSRLEGSDANVTLYMSTLGWIDTRGRI